MLFRRTNKGTFLNWRGYLLGIVLVAFTTWIKYLAQPDIIATPNSLLYILVIVAISIFFGLGPAIFVSLLSVILYAYFFLPPAFVFNILEAQQIITLIIFLVIAVTISLLASRLRQKTEDAIREISARKKSEAEIIKYRDQLEERVSERTTELESVNQNLKREIVERQKAELIGRQYTDDLMAISRAATALVELLPEGNIYQLTADLVWQLARGSRAVIVNSFDRSINLFHVQAVTLNQAEYSALTGILGQDLLTLSIPLTEDGRKALTSRRLELVPKGLHDLTAGLIPINVTKQIEESFGIGNVYVMGYYREGILYGSVNILMSRGSDLENRNIIETFIHQAGTALQLKITIEELEKARGALEEMVHERTRELEKSEEKYRVLVENANEAVVVFQDSFIKFFNRKALETSGYSQEELSNIPIVDLIHPDDRNMVIERQRKRLLGEAVPSSYEFRMIHRDGSIRWLNINAVLISWDDKPAVLGLLTDISERKNMEQELQAYALKITRVQEEERKRIAYELHDDTAQYLSILKLQLDSLLDSGKIQDPQILEKLRYLEKDAERAMNDVRRYSHELRPGVLEYLGLQAALEQTADDINKLQQITVEVNTEGEELSLPEDVKLGFFRIAQEALNNARKHARASRVIVGLKYSRNRILMTISDNGTGFDVQKAKVQTNLKGSLGLMSMQERAKLIGASLKIESKVGQGTVITVELSL